MNGRCGGGLERKRWGSEFEEGRYRIAGNNSEAIFDPTWDVTPIMMMTYAEYPTLTGC